MVVDKPNVQADGYKGDTAVKSSSYIEPRGAFRFMAT